MEERVLERFLDDHPRKYVFDSDYTFNNVIREDRDDVPRIEVQDRTRGRPVTHAPD